MTVGAFIYEVRKHLKLNHHTALYIYVGGHTLPAVRT